MTNITIQASGGSGGAPGTFRLTAVGHATGSGPTTGSGGVCAAVSGLVYALGGYLKNLERAGAVELRTFLLESGCAELEATGDAARAPFEMAAVGLLQIAASYPEQARAEVKNFSRSG